MGDSSNVFLAFPRSLAPNELFSLKRQYLPLGKIGGHPAWLNPGNLPNSAALVCRVCKQPLVFLLQIYCTGAITQTHAFHRTLFVFICRDAECSKLNDASNMIVFRCQLPRNNAFYSADSALNPHEVGDVPDPYFNKSTFAKLCRICGCGATKKCGRCNQQWYCSREHQIVDWSNGDHKKLCGKSLPERTLEAVDPNGMEIENDPRNTKTDARNPLVFTEFGVEMEQEYLDDENDNAEEEDSGDEEENYCEMDENELSKRLKELKKFENPEITTKDLEGIEEAARDELYKVFHHRVSHYPTQILRYDRGGRPLLATDHAPPPPQPIPACELCGAERTFELQLMPYLLSLIDVDRPGKSVDYATVLIYTCSRNCQIPNDGYSAEFVFKQDFTEHNDLISMAK